MTERPSPPSLLISPDLVTPFDRGNGVVTLPYVGRWNAADNRITTGRRSSPPGPACRCTVTTSRSPS